MRDNIITDNFLFGDNKMVVKRHWPCMHKCLSFDYITSNEDNSQSLLCTVMHVCCTSVLETAGTSYEKCTLHFIESHLPPVGDIK